jgi:hypothetical protein
LTCLYTSTQPTFPLGFGQTFIYQELSVTLNAKAFVYGPKTGNGTYLNLWAYDRDRIQEHLPATFYGDVGASHWEGDLYTPFEFEWRLQLLTEEVYEDLWSIYERAGEDGAPVRLLDGRLAMRDHFTRKRARVGGNILGAPVRPNRIYYWPQFNIELRMGKDRSRTDLNEYSLNMTAIEYDPDIPVPLSEDLLTAPFLAAA